MGVGGCIEPWVVEEYNWILFTCLHNQKFTTQKAVWQIL